MRLRRNLALDVFLLFVGVLIVIAWSNLRSKQIPRPNLFGSNTKQQVLACLMYSVDHDDRMPIASSWMDACVHYIKNDQIYRAKWAGMPAAGKRLIASVQTRTGVHKGIFGYALNSNLSSVDTVETSNSSKLITVFDSSNLYWNANDPVTSLPDPPRWTVEDKRAHMIGFLDGHTKAFRPEEIAELDKRALSK